MRNCSSVSILLFLLFFLFSGIKTAAQTSHKVLFLGNSYTGFNNLPKMVADAALSAGDTLIYDSNTPGGSTLEDHTTNTTSQAKIMAGGWDYVVLQGQSREPILQSSKFHNGGGQLSRQIRQHNPCAVIMLYMTWGRENGDSAYCPIRSSFCTYTDMDDELRTQYLSLASAIDAEVSPVSVVWRNLRQNHPGIQLYQVDESHPSVAGSYAAAASFYAAIFKKDPDSITFTSSLSATDAANIQNAAKTEVYDSLSLWDYKQLPQSDIRYSIGSGTNEVRFGTVSNGIIQDYQWDFGDSSTSTSQAPTHSYASNGSYTVRLTTTNCDLQGNYSSTSDTIIQFCSHTPTITTANPWLCKYDTLWTQTADSYQWYSHNSPIPDTTQYLADYRRYNGITVLTSVNGCSELSEMFSGSPQSSGYYFDAAMGGDPCKGDTALFTVHHINGSLTGTEIIRWYKNDTLLPSMNDKDTLFITTGGSYLCKVIDTNSNCPLDTTVSSTVHLIVKCRVFRKSSIKIAFGPFIQTLHQKPSPLNSKKPYSKNPFKYSTQRVF